MKAAFALSMLTMLLMGAALRSAEAHPAPYIRLGFGGNQLLMAEANDAIETEVGWAEDGGVPVSPQVVGPGYGPALSAGLWLFPALRVGATYGSQRSKVTHEYRQSGFVYDNEYQFEITEFGLEAAVRVPQWAGLTFGGQVAEGRGEAGQSYALENIHGEYREDLAAERTTRTYAVFFGFDNATEKGLAGYILAGYAWRDLGELSGTRTIDDNGTVYDEPIVTVPLDYSGWSVRVGLGYDFDW